MMMDVWRLSRWHAGRLLQEHDTMTNFSVIILTAAPAGQAGEAGGAYVTIDGREALLRSVELFLNREPIKHIQLVVNPDDLEDAKARFGGHLSFAGVKLTAGGPKWFDQIVAEDAKTPADTTHVIVHDAARPAVPYSDIDNLMEAATKKPVVALVSPVRSTLVEVDEGGNAIGYALASQYVQLLTPQIFSREKFKALVTSKVETHASEVTMVKGSPLNIRISGSGDAALAKTMLGLLPKAKIKAPLSPFDEAQW